MKTKPLIATAERERVAVLTLTRPPLNILNIETIETINKHLESLSSRTDLRTLLIEAEGKIFSAGVDIPQHRPDTVEQLLEGFHHTFRLLYDMPMVTVCAAHGGVYGGAFEILAFCDIALATDDCVFALPEIQLGVFPPVAAAHLAKVVGAKKAAELILTGESIDAAEALRIGLVNHVYPTESFAQRVDEFLEHFRKLSAFSLRSALRAFRRTSFYDFESTLAESESIYLKDLMSGRDPVEGLIAYIENREPRWQDR